MSRQQKQATVVNQPITVEQIAAEFWLMVEKLGSVKQKSGAYVPVLQCQYYGIRPTDTIQVTTAAGPAKKQVVDIWRTYAKRKGFEGMDLLVVSQQAKAAGLLKGNNPQYTVDGEKRSFGWKFWTLQNPIAAKSGVKSNPTSDIVDQFVK
jgi:hypothetical protein